MKRKNIERLNKLHEIAEEISYLDFSDVEDDCIDEAVWDCAYDLYEASHKEASEITKIVMKDYIQNIE